MNIAAISHRTTIEYCYALDENTVVVNLKTDKDVNKAFIVYEDPFIHELRGEQNWTGKKLEMKKLAELKYHVIWTVRLTPEYKRLQYYFELESLGECYVVCENKICPVSEADKTSWQYYKYAWLNSSDVIKPPAWVKDTVWYQIMPDRFCRAKDTPKDDKFRAWGDFEKPTWRDVYGGNLKGITEKLPYLKELGISGIYMTPIFRSGSNHKYNTYDYREVDPDFGTEEDLIELIDKAHEMGIRVMLDAVINHCGHEFFAWVDVFKKGKASKYYDWFFINAEDFAKYEFSTEDARYYSFSFWAGMPKLNTNNPEVVEYFEKLCTHWAKDWKIDGIRFDVGDEVSHTFIHSLNESVKKINPDIFFLGEIWMDSISWLGGREYDSVMNYPLPGCINDFWKNRELNYSDFIYSLNYCRTLYPEQTTLSLFNFLDTHDTSRVAEISRGNNELLQKLTVLMTMPGTACIYYGTEIAMKGLYTPYNRSTMPWDEIENGDYDEIKSKISKLISLRNENEEFKSNDIEYTRHAGFPRLVDYTKSGRIRVILNAEENPCEISVDGEIIYQNQYKDGKLLESGIAIIKLN